MAAEMAAIPLRRGDAATAVVTGNFNRTKREEGKSTPHTHTMISMQEVRKMITNNSVRIMSITLLPSNQHKGVPHPHHGTP
jgi:hypothetical protein